MGQIIVDQHVSADGFASDLAGGLDWIRSAGDIDATHDEQLKLLDGASAILLGRNTYELFVDFWPTANEAAQPVARPINTKPKHVISRTLDEAPWGNHTPAILERATPARLATVLRDSYDGDVIVWGSLTLTDALFKADEVDILRLRVVPLLLGAGVPAIPALDRPRPMQLKDAHTDASGLATLAYSFRK